MRQISDSVLTSGLKLNLLVDCEYLELSFLVEVLQTHLSNVCVNLPPVSVIIELPTVS